MNQFLAILGLLFLLLVPACNGTPAATAADAKAALGDAKSLLAQAADYVDQAQQAIDPVAEIAEAALAAKEAYDAEDYSTALTELRRAVDALAKAGVDVPPDVTVNLRRAQGLLMLVDQ